MRSDLNGSVTYLALQRLVECAWDAQDLVRLFRLSEAVDQHMRRCIETEYPEKKAV